MPPIAPTPNPPPVALAPAGVGGGGGMVIPRGVGAGAPATVAWLVPGGNGGDAFCVDTAVCPSAVGGLFGMCCVRTPVGGDAPAAWVPGGEPAEAFPDEALPEEALADRLADSMKIAAPDMADGGCGDDFLNVEKLSGLWVASR